MKTAAAEVIINGNAEDKCMRVEFIPLWSNVNRAISLMSCPHNVCLMFQSERTGGNKECDSVIWDYLACSPHFQAHRCILASRTEWVARSQTKQDVNVIISYSSSSKLGNRCNNQISGNFLKGPGRTRSFTDRLCMWQTTSIVLFI